MYHINNSKDKTHIISSDRKKPLSKILHPFMIKIGIDGPYLNPIEVIYEKPMASIIVNREKLTTFPLESGTR